MSRYYVILKVHLNPQYPMKNNPKPHLPNNTTISPESAVSRTKTWRSFITNHSGLGPERIPRGCRISMDDIIRLSRDPRFTGKNIGGVRAYFTCADNDTPDNVTEITLIFVPIDKDGNDMMVIDLPQEGVVVSAVEDFTKPCPSACDVN